MLDEMGRLIQIEINTIASSFPSIASRHTNLIRFMKDNFEECKFPGKIPDNHSEELMTEGL